MENCLALLSGTSVVRAKTVPACPEVFVVCEGDCAVGVVLPAGKWLAITATAATATAPPPPAASNVRARRREMRVTGRSTLRRGEGGPVGGSAALLPLWSPVGGVTGRGGAMTNAVRLVSLGATTWA